MYGWISDEAIKQCSSNGSNYYLLDRLTYLLPLGTTCLTVFGAHQHVTSLNSVWRLISSDNHIGLACSFSWAVANYVSVFFLQGALVVSTDLLRRLTNCRIIIIIIITRLRFEGKIWHSFLTNFWTPHCSGSAGPSLQWDPGATPQQEVWWSCPQKLVVFLHNKKRICDVKMHAIF